jgi:hypothetical protein
MRMGLPWIATGHGPAYTGAGFHRARFDGLLSPSCCVFKVVWRKLPACVLPECAASWQLTPHLGL